MAERIDRISQTSPAASRPGARERVAAPGGVTTPPVFRGWVANRLLGDQLRAALSPGFERAQASEATPMLRYMNETREALKTLQTRPEKEAGVQFPRRAEFAPILPSDRAALRENRSVASVSSADLAPLKLKLKLKLNPRLDAQRAVGRFQSEVDSLVPLSLTAPKLVELPTRPRAVPTETRTHLTRFDIKPTLPENRIPQLAHPQDLRLSETRTHLTRFDIKPTLPENPIPQLARPQNARREIFSSNEARATLRFTPDPAPKSAPPVPVVAATFTSARPQQIRATSNPTGVLKQVATSNDSRPHFQAISGSITPTTAAAARGANSARLTFSSPTPVRGDLTERAQIAGAPVKLSPVKAPLAPPGASTPSIQPAEPPIAPSTSPKTAPVTVGKAPAPVAPPVSDKQKAEKHEGEEVALKPVALDAKLRTSNSEPLRSLAARATRQALEGQEEAEPSPERPDFAIAPIQSLPREEKYDEKPAKKEEKEGSRSPLSGGLVGQAPIAPLQSFHQDERYGGGSPTFAPPRREDGTERKPSEHLQPGQAAQQMVDRAKEASPGGQFFQGQLAHQQNLSQKQQDQDRRDERNSQEAPDSEGVQSKKDSPGGSSKSGRGSESEQARRQQAQHQRQQQSSGKSQANCRPRYVTRPQDPEESEDIATSEDNGLNCCAKCGYLLGGSADLACPVCTSEQPDLALRIFTQYRQQGSHWITCADTLAVSGDALHSLAEMSTAPVHLNFVPKMPKYSQVLRFNQK